MADIDAIITNILRIMLLGEFDRDDPARNRELAEIALRNAGVGDADISIYMRDASQIVGPDLSPGAIISGPGSPGWVIDDLQYDTDGQRIHPSVPDKVFIGDEEDRRSARVKYETQRANREDTFRDYIGQNFNPGASPWLKRGLESRFDPMDLMYKTRGIMGNLRPTAEGDPESFQNYINRVGGGRPSNATLRRLAIDADMAIQGGFEGQGMGAQQDYFLGDRGSANQFNIALQSKLGTIPAWARSGYLQEATNRYNQFVARNPENSNTFLRHFMSGGGF